MSIVDIERISRYKIGTQSEMTVADVLANLKEELAEQVAALEGAAKAVKLLRIAIEAIEKNEANAARELEQQRPTRKRGHLSRAVLDCIREGVGTVALISKRLEERSIKTSRASISNAIQRLQDRKLIAGDISSGMWKVRPAADAGSIGAIDDEIYPRVEDVGHNEKAPH